MTLDADKMQRGATSKLQRTKSDEAENDKLLRDILPMYLEDFLKDFGFSDIQTYVNSQGIIFTEEDIQKISGMANEKHRIILMFQILIGKKKNLKAFLDILRKDYEWLHDRLKTGLSLYHEDKNIMKYLMVRHELRSCIPKHVDNNVRRIDLFAQTRNHLLELRQWHYLVIYGELGYGKKWLAMDASCDYSVIKAMDYKIFWLDVHNCDSQERDLEYLQKLKIRLGGSNIMSNYEGISNKILELQQDLKTILKQDEYKDCLLVLADVQNVKTIETFSLPCKILVTTRNKKIKEFLPKTLMKVVNIDEGLSRLEGVELFERVMEREEKNIPRDVYEIIECSKSHPFLLNIIAQRLKDADAGKWNLWTSNLRNFRIQNDTIHKVIKLSLSVLKPSELELFETLAIFYHSVKIPLSVLASYWGKSQEETEHLIKKFDRYSLVTKVCINDTNIDAIIIHILYYNYLQNCIVTNRVDLNHTLVDSYRIDHALIDRNDVNLSIPNDYYFYYYIGYHLKEAEMLNLFPKLYLDLGFLGQKLRNTGLPNTIGDLKYFRSQITNGDEDREEFIDALLEFLPNIEEMIFKSDDTYLMQYALMTNGLLHEKAVKQASAFPHHAWFSDSDHFHRRRQIVPLRRLPKIVKLVEPNSCLVALDNGGILVADLSLNYSHKPTYFADQSCCAIQQIAIFTANFFLSFDADRNIRVWSIRNERRESLTRRESLRFVVNQIDYSTCKKVLQKNSVQRISGYIQAFFIEDTDEQGVLLHTALSDGEIQIQKWNCSREKFEVEPYPPVQTNIKNIKFMLILQHLYVLLTKDGRLRMFSAIDNSECSAEFEFPADLGNPVNLHHYYLHESVVVLIFVFATKAFQVRLVLKKEDRTVRGTFHKLYEINDVEKITCSAMTDDEKYLIIGTKQGILVLDLKDRSEVLRNSISDHITCVDIYSLDDDIYKYIIISGSKNEKQLNIFGLKVNENDTLTWANSIGTFVNECNLNLRFEPTAWLVGKQLFDVTLGESRIVVAVDSKNRIHHMVDKDWNMILPIDLQNKITAIKLLGMEYFYGCQNGIVYDSQENAFETGLNGPIRLLEVFEPDFFVASTDSCSLIWRGEKTRKLRSIRKCYQVDRGYLLFVEDRCSVRLCNSFGDFEDFEYFLNDSEFADADLKQNILVVGGRRCCIYKYEICNDLNGKPTFKEEQCSCNTDGHITAIEVSYDVELCAVGFSTGLIEIRKLKTWNLIQQLESHHSQVYDLKFSPWPSSNLPLILASISEQICFWNITHAVNNPLEILSNGGRQSSRFSSRKKKRRSSDMGPSSNRNSAGYDVTDMALVSQSFWSNKRGAKEKQELLACIKFAGNKAEKLYANDSFTEFETIDDEGEMYFFKVKELIQRTNGCDNNAFNECNGNGNVQI